MKLSTNKFLDLVVVAVCLSIVTGAYAVEDGFGETHAQEVLSESAGPELNLFERPGLEFDVGVTQIYQRNVRGGLSTNSGRGEYSGSFDVELAGDLEELFGFEGWRFYMLNEGSWTDSEGIDAWSVGSWFGVNGDAAGDRAWDVTELWFEKDISDELVLRLGKIDLTGGFECKGCPVSFDGNAYANDETSQFLNNALVNNPTIPFPDNGLGAVLHYYGGGMWYWSIGIADAQADARETGFSTTFHEEDYYFLIAEAGLVGHTHSANGDLLGAARFGLWYDPQDKERFDDGETHRDDRGFYISADQKVYNESHDQSQGLGVFGRYGYASGEVNEVTNFVSFGMAYTGLFEGRDTDRLGVGFASGTFSDDDAQFTDDYERVIEAYYSIDVADWISVSPSVQYVANPGGNDVASDAVVVGLRTQMVF
ncbi:carbohydrate porin [Anaerohalosphaera lusitana]|uniref:carbohydrate porin n=1 Tax=Anaerohalosphaera lusitana TaxID=1936003 RepID=UPI001475B726|nr:carbohydrate porin [Anaerohalosphaera lusitana]